MLLFFHVPALTKTILVSIIAAAGQADLILICPRTIYGDQPTIGPKSVGYVARFVLDHAPCPILLARPVARKEFPLPK